MPGLWKRLMYRLSHRAARDAAQREHERCAAAIASAAGPDQSELVALVSMTLFHQGAPLENARRIAELLDAGRSYGWDEASYDVSGESVEVSFLGDTLEVDRAELRTLVTRIIERLETLEREPLERAP